MYRVEPIATSAPTIHRAEPHGQRHGGTPAWPRRAGTSCATPNGPAAPPSSSRAPSTPATASSAGWAASPRTATATSPWATAPPAAPSSPRSATPGASPTDPLGTFGQGEATLFAGTGSEDFPAAPRWGDYSNMSVDPVDDCTFWYTQEYFSRDRPAQLAHPHRLVQVPQLHRAGHAYPGGLPRPAHCPPPRPSAPRPPSAPAASGRNRLDRPTPTPPRPAAWAWATPRAAAPCRRRSPPSATP